MRISQLGMVVTAFFTAGCTTVSERYNAAERPGVVFAPESELASSPLKFLMMPYDRERDFIKNYPYGEDSDDKGAGALVWGVCNEKLQGRLSSSRVATVAPLSLDHSDTDAIMHMVRDINFFGSSPFKLEVVSAYTKEIIYRIAGEDSGDPRALCGKLAPELIAAFRPGAPLHRLLFTQRLEAAQKSHAQSQTSISAGASLSADDIKKLVEVTVTGALSSQNIAPSNIVSDVDTPLYNSRENPDDVAVVVGIEKYANGLPDAQYAERDADAVKKHLVALGYPERNIKFLAGTRATKGMLEGVLEDWLPRRVKENSRVFFYFSGHGAPDLSSNQAFIVPSDGDPNLLDKTAYSVKKLYANLNGLKAKQVIVALDSCFSGAGARSVMAHGTRPLVTKVDASVPAEGKLVLLAAAAPQEIAGALDDQGHGIFTYFLLKGINDLGAKNLSGGLSAQGLYNYLKPKVQDVASRQNREQTPVLEGDKAREIAHFEHH